MSTTARSPLAGWLARRSPLEPFIDTNGLQVVQELGGFLALDEVHPLHKVAELPAQSLIESWQKTREYVNDALALINSDAPGWLDREEVQMILEALGAPPPHCYPIYIMSVGDGASERVVYVGKTNTTVGRFAGGHAAITKLHAPEYDGLPKRIYRGCVVLLNASKSIVPLEWMSSAEQASTVLSSVEAQLIYELQPELNTNHRERYNASFPIALHIQNFTGSTELLDGETLLPNR